MSKSQRHTRSDTGRGVNQANEAAINPNLTGLCQHEIGRSRVHGRLYRSFCPITLQHFSFRS